jgi:hypothetical protein
MRTIEHHISRSLYWSLLAGLLGWGIAATSASAEVGPLVLPDNRGYEQVSPIDKSGTDVEARIAMAAVGGNRFMFLAKGSFAGQPTALSAEGTNYLATRGATGWSTEGIALPGGKLSFGNSGYIGFTPDMSKGIISWAEESRLGTFDPAAQKGYNNYLRDNTTGSFQLINGTLAPAGCCFNGFIWGTPDFGKLALTSSERLTPDSPCDPDKSSVECAYEWDHGTLRLASILPDGTPVRGPVGADGKRCNYEHVLSADGTRLFFTNTAALGRRELYVREGGTTTLLVSASERSLSSAPSAGGGANFEAAEAAHGSRVLFSTKEQLVNEDMDTGNDLYLYDFDAPAGDRLTLVSRDRNPEGPVAAAAVIPASGKSCGGVVATSDDLRRVYFVAAQQIVPGAPETEGPKMFLWDDTGTQEEVRYIGTLDESDVDQPSVSMAPAIEFKGEWRRSRWTSDGRFVAFLSRARLTPFDNEGAEEVYRYDAVLNELVCVSCVADATPATGEIGFNETYVFVVPGNHMLQNVSTSGQVFFHTTRALVPRDSNGIRDVYEYEDGNLHLLSSGTGASPASFLDATPSGSDVFLTTRDRLVGWDRDGSVDAYDARVGGGFPEPPPPLPPCEGDGCQPPPIALNDPTPSSATFSGPGNQRPKHHRCKRQRRKSHRPAKKCKKAAHRKQSVRKASAK